MKQFGEFVKELRLSNDYTLREFCKKFNHDPGNWSRMERGGLPAPRKQEKLTEIAKQLGLVSGSDDWYDFFDLASTASGVIPKDILSDEELVNKLPLFFRTLRSTKPAESDLKRLVETLRNNP